MGNMWSSRLRQTSAPCTIITKALFPLFCWPWLTPVATWSWVVSDVMGGYWLRQAIWWRDVCNITIPSETEESIKNDTLGLPQAVTPTGHSVALSYVCRGRSVSFNAHCPICSGHTPEGSLYPEKLPLTSNYRLTRAWGTVECGLENACGILASRFRVFHHIARQSWRWIAYKFTAIIIMHYNSACDNFSCYENNIY